MAGIDAAQIARVANVAKGIETGAMVAGAATAVVTGTETGFMLANRTVSQIKERPISAVAGGLIASGYMGDPLNAASNMLFDYPQIATSEQERLAELVNQFYRELERIIQHESGNIRADFEGVEIPADEDTIRAFNLLPYGTVQYARESMTKLLNVLIDNGVKFGENKNAIRQLVNALHDNRGSRFRIGMLNSVSGLKLPLSAGTAATIISLLNKSGLVNEGGYIDTAIANIPSFLAVTGGTLGVLHTMHAAHDYAQSLIFSNFGLRRMLAVGDPMMLRGRGYLEWQSKKLISNRVFRDVLIGFGVLQTGAVEALYNGIMRLAEGYSDLAVSEIYESVEEQRALITYNKTQEAYLSQNAKKRKEYEKNHKPIGQKAPPAYDIFGPPPQYQPPAERTEVYSFDSKSWVDSRKDYKNVQNTAWNKWLSPLQPVYNVTGDNTPPVAATHGQNLVPVFAGEVPQATNFGPIPDPNKPLVTPVMAGTAASPSASGSSAPKSGPAALVDAPMGATTGDPAIDELSGKITEEKYRSIDLHVEKLKNSFHDDMEDRGIQFSYKTFKISKKPDSLSDAQDMAVRKIMNEMIQKLNKARSVYINVKSVDGLDNMKRKLGGRRGEMGRLMNGINKMHKDIFGEKFYSKDVVKPTEEGPTQGAGPMPQPEPATPEPDAGAGADIPDPSTVPNVDKDTLGNLGRDYLRDFMANDVKKDSPFLRALMFMTIKKLSKKVKKMANTKKGRYAGLKVNRRDTVMVANSFDEFLPLR